MAGAELLNVDVAYVEAHEELLLTLRVPPGASARHVLERARVVERFPELAERPLAVGINGVTVDIDTLVEEGDRVELYRPLRFDPKEARRRRAARVKLSPD